MQKQVTVSLGGREFTITALPIAPAKRWRDSLEGPFKELSDMLRLANTAEVETIADIASLVQAMSGTLLGAVDKMLDLFFSYAANISLEDREWIEQNAYDEEALRAFVEVLKLAFPFGVLLEVVIGPQATKTSPSLLSQNGVSPLPASGPKRKEKAK